MKTLNLGIALGGILFALIFTPILVQAGSLTASDQAGANFKPATLKAQTMKPADAGAAPGAASAAPGFAPAYSMPAAPAQGAPTAPFAAGPQKATTGKSDDNSMA